MNNASFPPRFWVVGTDTDVGKTIVSAALCHVLGLTYFKPIQSGCKTDSDTRTVLTLCEGRNVQALPEVYRFSEPLSPHRAAELDGVVINIDQVKKAISETPSRCVLEAAGGLMVPITRSVMQIDLIALSHFPVVLVTRTTLGTINHTLLSVEALLKRGVPLHSLVFNGEENPDNIRTIMDNVPQYVKGFHLTTCDTSNTDRFQSTTRSVFSHPIFLHR